ncbi:MAG: hypothetical protein ABSG07_20040 [Terriglobales bacterium]|jgi:uncharacterized membrane protein YczE
MTGSWLIVKWLGITVLSVYLVLMLVVFRRFRSKLAELRGGLIWPIVVGNFIGICLPLLYENVAFKRACFVVASAVYACGIALLVRGLRQPGNTGFLKKGGAEDYIQPLKLS